MRDAQPRTIFLKDYRPPSYSVTRTELHFELFDDHALVHSRLHFARGDEAAGDAPLELNGVDLETLEVRVDGEPVPDARLSYSCTCRTAISAPSARPRVFARSPRFPIGRT